MKLPSGASGFVWTCILAAPQATFPTLTFALAVPTSDDAGLWHTWTNAEEPKDVSSEAPVQVDVIIVGGGFSGLSSAYALQMAGLSTVVLEASDVLGGRSRSHKLDSGPGLVELGATWINNKTQPAVFALTEEFGLETIEQYNDGVSLREFIDGTVVEETDDEDEEPSDDNQESEEALALEEIQGELMLAMETAVETMDIRTFDNFQKDEDVSLADWVAQIGLWEHSFVQAVCSQLTTSIVGREPHDIGAHYWFDYIKSGGGFRSLLAQDRLGAQALMIKTGTTSIATSMGDALLAGSLLKNSPVKSIIQSDSTVLATTKSGKQFESKKAILAIMPSTYSKINFSPPLPSDKQGLVSASKVGIYAKILLSYTTPWWRDAGLNGNFFSYVGPITYGLDTSVPSLSQYSLALFVAGDFAEDWQALPDPEKEGAIVEHLATMVGEGLADQARDTLEVNFVEWNKEEYIGGGPTNSMGPGMLRKYGDTLRASVGHLHFAGTETAFEWKGYLEGAVTAGQRAAEEVITAMGIAKSE